MVAHFWALADGQVSGDRWAGLTPDVVDDLLGQPGAAAAIESVGWIIFDSDGAQLPGYSRHNGETARERALAARRQERARRASTCHGHVTLSSRCARDDSVTREREREDIPPPTPPAASDAARPVGARVEGQTQPNLPDRRAGVLARRGISPAGAQAILDEFPGATDADLARVLDRVGVSGGPGACVLALREGLRAEIIARRQRDAARAADRERDRRVADAARLLREREAAVVADAPADVEQQAAAARDAMDAPARLRLHPSARDWLMRPVEAQVGPGGPLIVALADVRDPDRPDTARAYAVATLAVSSRLEHDQPRPTEAAPALIPAALPSAKTPTTSRGTTRRRAPRHKPVNAK